MTFSVVCYDRNSEAWGVGVASKFLAVGSTVPWASNNNFSSKVHGGEIDQEVLDVLLEVDKPENR